MRKIILVTSSIHGLHALEFAQGGKNIFQKSGLVHQMKRHGRLGTQKHLVQFLCNPLLGKDRHPIPHPFH